MLDLVIPVVCRPQLAALVGAAFLSVAGSGCGAGPAGGAGGSGGAVQGTGGGAGQIAAGNGGSAGTGGGSAGRGGTTARHRRRRGTRRLRRNDGAAARAANIEFDAAGLEPGQLVRCHAQRDQLGQPHRPIRP